MKDKQADQAICVNGITIAPGVVETIISLSAAEVAGVAGVGTAGPISSIVSAFGAGKAIPSGGIEVTVQESGEVAVAITVQVFYGYRLVDIADKVRVAVADALRGQIGANVSSVDVYIDAISSEE